MKTLKKVKKLKLNIRLPRSNVVYNRLTAKRYHDIRYYSYMESEIQRLPYKELEKRRLSTSHRKRISDYIGTYKRLLEKKYEGIFNKLASIYNKNRDAAIAGQPPPINSNLLYLASSVPMLVTANKKIRKNKGATFLGSILSNTKSNRFPARQKSFLNKTFHLPDGMSKPIFLEASRLLRAGKYPRGASRRIWAPKPGRPDSLRPINFASLLLCCSSLLSFFAALLSLLLSSPLLFCCSKRANPLLRSRRGGALARRGEQQKEEREQLLLFASQTEERRRGEDSRRGGALFCCSPLFASHLLLLEERRRGAGRARANLLFCCSRSKRRAAKEESSKRKSDSKPKEKPPFMDRVVQSAIQMILQATYSSWFDKQNVSFGFRPGKGVHDERSVSILFN